MDSKDFEDLSRRVGAAASRRSALKLLAGGMAASALAVLRPGRGAADDVTDVEVANTVPILHCRATLFPCHEDRQCCSGICKKELTVSINGSPPIPLAEGSRDGVCDCRPKGATCYRLVEGAFCCSGRCTNEAKCA